MEYGDLITNAWRITWRERSLWVVGLFAGSASGSCSGFSSGAGNTSTTPIPTTVRQADITSALAAIEQVLPLLIAAAVLFVVVWLGFWLLSVVCKGAIIAAGRGATAGEYVSLGGAWRAGQGAFGRLVGLDLALGAVGLILLGAVVLFALSALRSQPETFEWLPLLSGLITAAALIGLLANVVGVVVAYAQRVIVLDGRGPIAGLGAAVALLRGHLGTSVILWLISLALSVGGGIVLILGLLVVAIPGLIVGGILSFLLNVAGLGGIPALIVTAVVVLGGALLVGGAVLNTFLWHFWTVAYVRLTGPAPVPAPSEPLPESS